MFAFPSSLTSAKPRNLASSLKPSTFSIPATLVIHFKTLPAKPILENQSTFSEQPGSPSLWAFPSRLRLAPVSASEQNEPFQLGTPINFGVPISSVYELTSRRCFTQVASLHF